MWLESIKTEQNDKEEFSFFDSLFTSITRNLSIQLTRDILQWIKVILNVSKHETYAHADFIDQVLDEFYHAGAPEILNSISSLLLIIH